MIPYDATQHIQGISQGVGSAMPSLIDAGKRNAPGSPTLERFINEFEARVSAGEHPQSVGDDLYAQFENDIRNGVQHADVNVPDVGFNNGTPAVGGADSLKQPVAQYPNSFNGTGMLQSFQNSPAPASGGIGGNAQPPPATPSGGLPPINNQPVDVPSNTANGPSATLSRPGTDSFEKTMDNPNPIPYEETPKDNINLLKRDAGNTMQTQTGGKIPPMRSRGEQEQALSDIERIKKMENADGGLQFKQNKLELESKIKILKAMSNRLSDQEKMDLMRTLKTEGMTMEAQIAVMNATIRMKNAEDLNKTRQETNRIKANKASDKIPPALQHLWVRYKAAADEIARYNTSLVAGKNGNPERVKQLKKVAAAELHQYNLAAIDAGLPERTDKDLNIPEVFGDNDPNNKVEE